MTSPIESKAPQDLQVRLRQSSLEDATEIKYSPRLPQEIWFKVAADLEDASLKSLSEVSRDSYLGALREYNVRQFRLAINEFEDLKKLDDLNPSFKEISVSKTAFVKYNLRNIFAYSAPPISLELQESIKQKLIALTTNEIYQDLLALKAQCYNDINDETTRFETIEQMYDSCKTSCIVKALNCLISSAPNANCAMNSAIQHAGIYGFPGILTALLEQGQLSKQELMQAMKYAITAYNDKEVAIFLAYFVEHFTMTGDDREGMMEEAALQGFVKVLQDFMQAGLLFEAHAAKALFTAAQFNRVEVVKTLLEEAKISDEDRRRAFELADQNGHLEIAELLRAR